MNINKKTLLGVSIIVALGSALGLSGCAPQTSSVSEPQMSVDEMYYAAVTSAAPGLSVVSQDTLVTAGHQFCDLADTEGFFAAANDTLTIGIDAGLSGGEIGAIVGAATMSYCPEYKSDMDAYISAVS